MLSIDGLEGVTPIFAFADQGAISSLNTADIHYLASANSDAVLLYNFVQESVETIAMNTWLTDFQDDFEAKLSALLGKTYDVAPVATSETIDASLLEHIEKAVGTINGLEIMGVYSGGDAVCAISPSNTESVLKIEDSVRNIVLLVDHNSEEDLLPYSDDELIELWGEYDDTGYPSLLWDSRQDVQPSNVPTVDRVVVCDNSTDVGQTASYQVNGVDIPFFTFNGKNHQRRKLGYLVNQGHY